MLDLFTFVLVINCLIKDSRELLKSVKIYRDPKFDLKENIAPI